MDRHPERIDHRLNLTHVLIVIAALVLVAKLLSHLTG
jgi:hypothetical protein